MKIQSRFAGILLLCLLMTSCARKIMFENSSVVPAAEGSVKVKKDKNSNYALDVSVKNLAESKRLTPPRDTYIVWIETERDGTRNIGQLNSSNGLFSSKLKASLKTVSSYKPTRLYITAEDNGTIQFPGSQLVLSTATF